MDTLWSLINVFNDRTGHQIFQNQLAHIRKMVTKKANFLKIEINCKTSFPIKAPLEQRLIIGKDILEQLSKTRFFTVFENTALYFPAT